MANEKRTFQWRLGVELATAAVILVVVATLSAVFDLHAHWHELTSGYEGSILEALLGIVLGALAAALWFSARRLRDYRQALAAAQANEEALRSSRARFRDLVEGSAQGVIVHRNLRPIFANEAAARIFGLEGVDALLALESLLPLFDETEQGPLESDAGVLTWKAGAARRHEVSGRRQDGSRIALFITTRMVDWESEPATQLTVADSSADGTVAGELGRQESLLRHAATIAKLGHWVWDLRDDQIKSCSEQLAQIFGTTAADLVRELRSLDNYTARIHPEDRARYRAMIDESRRSGKSYDIQFRIRRNDGDLRQVREIGEYRPKETPHNSEAIGIVQDITARAETEHALKETEARLQGIFANSPGPIFLKDLDGRFLLINQRFEQWYGLAAADVIGKRSADLFPKEQADAFVAHDQEIITERKPVQREHVVDFGDGSTRNVLVTKFPVFDASGEMSGVGTINIDITDRKTTEAALAESRDQLERRVLELEDLRQRLEDQAGNAIFMAEELNDAKTQLSDAVESISEGFALWGVDDRLIMCNDRYRNTYPDLDDVLRPGVLFEDFARVALERGVFGQEDETLEEALHERVIRHKTSVSAYEQQLGDGRWIRVSKRKTKTGRVVGILTDISERKSSEAKIERMALEDALTRLPNRTQFHNKLRDAITQAKRIDRLVGVMILDLDHFKHVNDTMGHPGGDELLCKVAERLDSCIRATDTVARLGGDEFAVIVTNAENPDGITATAARIVEAIARPFVLQGQDVHTGTSIGMTIYPFDNGTPDQLLRNADLALYRAKEEGRGSFQLFDQAMHDEVQERRALEADLRLALKREELGIVYQPQFDAMTGEIVGAEALLRWHHPTRGSVPPAEFIPLAEATRLIFPISEWVLETVCAQNKSWHENGFPGLRVSVNISPLHFKQQNLVEQIRLILLETGLEPAALELEITEGMAMAESTEAHSTLDHLKRLGIRLAIDDFGTGYSSLNRLKRFPVDRLKIDQSFVRDITTDWDDAAINSAVIRIGHSLNIRVIAEGVETTEQMRFLVEHGCNEVQGYLLSPPLPAEELAAFMRAHEPSNIIDQVQPATARQGRPGA